MGQGKHDCEARERIAELEALGARLFWMCVAEVSERASRRAGVPLWPPPSVCGKGRRAVWRWNYGRFVAKKLPWLRDAYRALGRPAPTKE